MVEKIWHPDVTIHFMLWTAVTLSMTFALMPAVKGAIVGGIALGIVETLGAGYISVPYKDAFAFSVQTFATIGYGAMAPKTTYAPRSTRPLRTVHRCAWR